jgi:hypothetical protein
MPVPIYLAYFVVGGSIAIIAAILIGTNAALARVAWPADERTAAVRNAAIVLIAWFALAWLLAWLGAYRGVAERAPTIQFGLLIPILIGAWLIWRSPAIARLIDAVPQSWLIGAQLYRVLGAIFLVLYAGNRIPGLFALPAGIGDVTTGLLAPVVAFAYAGNPRGQVRSVLAWNVFGIADLVVAVSTGLLTSPSPLQRFALDAPNELITAFPLVLVPTFLVPISILLHIASLTKLRREAAHLVG